MASPPAAARANRPVLQAGLFVAALALFIVATVLSRNQPPARFR